MESLCESHRASYIHTADDISPHLPPCGIYEFYPRLLYSTKNAVSVVLYPLTYKVWFVIYSLPHVSSTINFQSDFTQCKFTFMYKSTPNFRKLPLEKLVCLYARDYSLNCSAGTVSAGVTLSANSICSPADPHFQ